MVLTKYESAFLEENADLIETENWTTLYFNSLANPANIRLYEILKSAGIDLLQDYHICPAGYASNSQALPTSLNIPEGVESIGSTAFQNTITLEKVHLPTTLKKIGIGAFNNCRDLSTINIPASVELLDMGAFKNCSALTNVVFAKTSNLFCIGGGVFQHSGLVHITLPEGIQYIGGSAFKDCYFLTQMDLPKSLTKIAQGAISGAAFLKTIKYASNKDNFKKIELEDGWIVYQEEPIKVKCTNGTLKILAGEVVDK